ncbi:hypothetical protein EWM64_g8677 [Hericium alpestre]|uniref:Pheromone n=1 Tax=Hericium alpestre TaxID=135208 RepID=A0A4Y9ZL32_9AGAM|nr:hypothetical protein EWM64_g8677 [Hericium alpestre]
MDSFAELSDILPSSTPSIEETVEDTGLPIDEEHVGAGITVAFCVIS